MKILLTNNCLGSFCGTESWIYAMAKELSKKHQVTVFSPSLGNEVTKKIREVCDVIQFYKGEYDLAIVNHTTTWEKLPEDLPKIFTSHSKIYAIEQPPYKDYVGVTEAIGGVIIRNGIDCERFKPTSVNEKLKNVLLLSNPMYSGGVEFVKKAIGDLNLIVIERQTFDIEEYINQADLVISLSRGALESMACGKNVIYGDYRKGWMNEFRMTGMINQDNFEEFKRGEMVEKLKPVTAFELKRELEKYSPKRGEWLREQVIKDFNIEKTAEQYLRLFHENINNNNSV